MKVQQIDPEQTISANPNHKKKMKHNYTSELELKSLLIRIKNERADIGTLRDNAKINKYIKWHTAIVNKKYKYPSKRNITKNIVKERIIKLSECTRIDPTSYERFGEIILLMIKNILKKPQFSGYTYKDDFYSDAIYKILKYLHNFDHQMTSKITGQAVNAFAYISQIIHNSILFILNQKKNEQEKINKQVEMEKLNHNYELQYTSYYNEIDNESYKIGNVISEKIVVKEISTNLLDVVKELSSEAERVQSLEIVYPHDYRISFDEYNILKDYLKGKISITRAEEPK
ncbi:hypothetical protein Va1_290 [Vibrio phage Va1]|nr:hypothetical protein Va1_290 [Vibrio phage Va1]